MSPAIIFQIHLVLGYVPWLLCFSAYVLALLAIRIRLAFWTFVVAFNVVGAVDILVDYYHGNQLGLPALAGELGAAYAIPIIYVPVLMITHALAFYLLVGRRATDALWPRRLKQQEISSA